MSKLVGEYQEFSKKKRLYRKVFNVNSNDWNDEPEFIVIPYTIWGEKKNSYVVTRAGWDGKKQRHLIPKRELFENKEEAMKYEVK